MEAATEMRVFTMIYGHCLTLQVVKDVQIYRTSSELAPTFLLAAAIVWSHLSRSESALLGLAASALLVLCTHGSQSNHVTLEAIIALGVLLTAPAPRWRSASSKRSHPGEAETEREQRRLLWSGRLTVSMRAVLGVLYAMTGFAKLNDAWHDPHVSCCVQMFLGSVANFVDVRLLPPVLLRSLPYGATAFELGFPLALAGAHVCETTSRPGAARAVLRALTIMGAIFHVVIALPPPPMSVYPFSMIMAPIYFQSLLPDDVRRAARTAAAWLRNTHVLVVAVIAVAVAGALRVTNGTTRGSVRFEYPPYFSWELGVLWTLCSFGGLATVAALAPAAPSAPRGARATYSKLRLTLALVPAACVFAVACSTYVGVRTYPSFAMFSNLVVEGGMSNHWLVQRPSDWALLAPPEYGPHRAIEILETDLPALRDLQVNLAPLLPPEVLEAFRVANASAELYITPPAWPYAPTEPFRPFAIPIIEVRRRLAVAALRTSDFYVRYRDVPGVIAAGGDSAGAGAVRAEDVVREYRRQEGELMPGSDASLEKPLPPLRALLHKYRTFDRQGRAPCRH